MNKRNRPAYMRSPSMNLFCENLIFAEDDNLALYDFADSKIIQGKTSCCGSCTGSLKMQPSLHLAKFNLITRKLSRPSPT